MALMTICEAGGICSRLNKNWSTPLRVPGKPEATVSSNLPSDSKERCAYLVAKLIETGREEYVEAAECGYEAQFYSSQDSLKKYLEGAQNA